MNRAVVNRALARVAVGALVALGASAGAATAAAPSTQQEIAKAGVLRISDFPTDWKQSKRAASADDALGARAAKVPSCKPFLGYSTASTKNLRAKSPGFDLGQAHVDNTVSIYSSAAKATAAMQTFDDPQVPKCLDDLFSLGFDAQLAKDKKTAKLLQSVKVDIGKLDGVEIGDQAAAYQGTASVTLKDGTVTTFGLALIPIRVGNAIATYTYSADSDISAPLQPAIVSSVSRLKAATTAATG